MNVVKESVTDPEHIEKVKRCFLSLRDVFCIRDFVRGWFFGRPWEDIRRGNLYNFTAYSFYSSEMSGLPPQV